MSLQAIRRAALEDAIKVCSEVTDHPLMSNPLMSMAWKLAARECADRIRIMLKPLLEPSDER